MSTEAAAVPDQITGYPALPPKLRTIQHLITAQAERLGDRPCVSIGAVSLSYADVRSSAACFAGTLRNMGIEPGDRVAVISENRWEVMQLLLACAWTGAILVPLNTASRGAQLQHLLTNAGPKLVAGEAGLLPTIAAIRPPPEVERLLRIGVGDEVSWGDMRSAPFPQEMAPVTPASLGPGDPFAILGTSGTTGPSKGVICPHAQFYWWGVNMGSMLAIQQDDVLYTCLPLFHTNALNAFAQALIHGAQFVVGPRFSSSHFWERTLAANATVTYLFGPMVSMLLSGDVSPQDRSHRLRVALAPGTAPELCDAFATRFGIKIVEAHGMTETNAVIGPRDGEQRAGWMGRVMPGFEVRVVDEDDVPVPDGAPGELVMRASEPYSFSSGYWRMPEATVASWRNLWFHSGDRVVREDGWLRFLDRIKDSIRRRGENVSAWEVEQVLLQHGDVEAAAVIPVPSRLGEDDVMAYVVPRRGAQIDLADLARFCEPRLPYFAIPRYFDLLERLPLTSTGKVEKYSLRERGIGAAAWDRDPGSDSARAN